MKVLYIIDSLHAGGKERRLIQSLNGLIKKKDFNALLIIQDEKIFYKEISKLPIRVIFLKRNLFKDYLILNKFLKIIKEFEPDIVHCWYTIAAIHFAPICTILKIPFINSGITAAPKTRKLSKRYIANALTYPFSNVILSNSQAGLDELFVPVEKQKVIYNGFDFRRLNNLKDKNSLLNDLKINKPIIGMIASFSKRKDHHTLLKAANVLSNKCYFVLIGNGETFEEIMTLATIMKLHNTIFLGYQNDVESIINIFDIGVLLSNNNIHGEGISNSILEYMALGKPVIATDNGGTHEIVLNNQTGFLIQSKNDKQLVERIDFLLENPQCAFHLGQQGKTRIENFFSFENMVDQTHDLYQNVIKKPKYKKKAAKQGKSLYFSL